ncbi:partial Transcriptional regulator MraZ, partial [Gammaproteobacteria bacterium]
MFLGEYTHALDDKGRLTLPAKYRAELATGLVVTRGIDKCLFVFPMTEWKTLSDKLSALPLTDPQAREFQ